MSAHRNPSSVEKGRGFNPALRKRCASINRQLVKLQTATMIQAHALGKQLKEIRDSDAYGYRAFERALDDLIDLDPATAAHYIAFAEVWSRRELKALLTRRTASGRMMRFGHFLALTALIGQQDRASFIEKIFDKELSARDLGRLVEKHLREQQKIVSPRRNRDRDATDSGPGSLAQRDQKPPRTPNRRVRVSEEDSPCQGSIMDSTVSGAMTRS